MSNLPQSVRGENHTGVNDLREALFNDGGVGHFADISCPEPAINRLLAIMFDFDPKCLARGNPWFPPDDDPGRFLENIAPVLERHPLTRDAEIRASGNGLHAILWLEGGVEIREDVDRDRWRSLATIVQCSLPVDPMALGIQLFTRPVGATNSKNGQEVRLLRRGTPVAPSRVEAFVHELRQARFRVLAGILLGSSERLECPWCGGRRFRIHKDHGRCYSCKEVGVDALMSLALGDAELTPSRARVARKSVRTASPLKPRRPRYSLRQR
jgi:hypothetical protein